MKISGDLRQVDKSLSLRANDTAETRKAKEKTPLERLRQGLDEMNANLKSVQSANSPKQRAANRMNILKQRLEAMKEILLRTAQFMSPVQAKAMVRELKQIAKEMADAARTLGGGAGTQAPVINFSMLGLGAAAADEDSASASAEAAAQQAEAAAGEGAAQAQMAQAEAEAAGAANAAEAAGAAGAAEAAANEAENAENAAEDVPGDPNRAEGGRPASTGESGDSDGGLRLTLREMSRLVKHILEMLKSKLTDEEGQKDAAAVEKELKDMEKVLMQGADIYDVQGVPVSVEAPEVSVDVSA